MSIEDKKNDIKGHWKIEGNVGANNLNKAMPLKDITDAIDELDDVKAEKSDSVSTPNSVKGNNTDATANAFDVLLIADSDYTTWDDKKLVYSGALKTVFESFSSALTSFGVTITSIQEYVYTTLSEYIYSTIPTLYIGKSTAPNSVKGNNTDATANAFDVSITSAEDYTSWTDKLLVYSGVLKTIITNIFASIGTNTTNISTLEDTISTLAGAKATFTFAEYTLTTSKVKLDLVLDAQSSNTDIFEVDETNDWVDVKIDSGFASALNLDFIKSGATDVVVTFNVYNSSDVLFETHSFTLKGTGSISQVVNLLSASVPVDTYYMTVSVASAVGTIVLQSSSKALMDASINGSGVFQMQEPSTELTTIEDSTAFQVTGNKKTLWSTIVSKLGASFVQQQTFTLNSSNQDSLFVCTIAHTLDITKPITSKITYSDGTPLIAESEGIEDGTQNYKVEFISELDEDLTLILTGVQ